MTDIAPGLFEKIKNDFNTRFSKSQKIKELYLRINNGVATYKEAQKFAAESGRILSESIQGNLSSSILPDGRLYYNIADRILRPMLENNYELISDVSVRVQTILNKKNNIGIKAIKPEMNEDKVQGIIDIVSGKEKYDDIAYMVGDPIVNFSQTIVDDAVKSNADFQWRSGLTPKIIRTSPGKCCEWCDKLVGVYDYEDVKNTGNNVFKRHKNCICLVEFTVEKNRQNVHSKKTAQEEEIKRRIENSFTQSKERNKKTKEQAKALQEKLSKEVKRLSNLKKQKKSN